jgi:3-methyladenine DNA glycosylase AlkD
VEAEIPVTAVAAWVDVTVDALTPLAEPKNAEPMSAYMKQVAPFLGITTPLRRAALKSAWADLGPIDESTLVQVAQELWALSEREYQYAAGDLIDRGRRGLSRGFLTMPVQGLLTDKPWWDTVDLLGSAAVSPITARHPELVALMWSWLDSGDRWLIRAAIQHQRGRKEDTDFGVLYAMCDRFATDREFFIAKAIGWALRDATRWDRPGVQAFVDAHPDLSSVARREAIKGLARSARP